MTLDAPNKASRPVNTASRAYIVLRSVGSAGILFTARASAVIYQLRFANHAFGPSYGGLIALLNQITFYILLAELGLAAATTSLLFEPAHRNDRERVKALVQALEIDVHRILRYLAPLALLMSAVLSVCLRQQISLAVLFLSLVFTSMSALLTFMALPCQSLLNASDRVPTRNLILAGGFLLKVCLGVALAQAMNSFVGLSLGTAVVGVAEYLLQRGLVRASLPRDPVTPKLLAEARAAIREKAKYVVAHRVGYLFIYQSDYVILLLSSSLSLLSYYAQYQYIYAGILSFSIAVGGTLTARVAKQQIDLGVWRYLPYYRKTSLLAACAAVACGVCFYLFADIMIMLLYGSPNRDRTAVFLFAALLMLNVFKMNDDIWVDTTGSYKTGYYLPIMEACTYVILGLSFVHLWKMPGVLYAGIATNLLFSIFLKSFVVGGGVMHHRILATLSIKVGGLIAMAGACYVLVALAHLLPLGLLLKSS